MEQYQNPKLKHIESGAEINVTQSPFLIGRGLSCHFVIPSEVISRLHCELEKQGNRWLLKDKSRNGTYINETCAKTDGEFLNNEDKITLGPEEQTYRFLFPAPSALPTTVPLIHNRCTQATSAAQVDFPEDYVDLLNSDLELEAVLSSIDSPLSTASSSNNKNEINVYSRNSPQSSIADVIPGPSTSVTTKSLLVSDSRSCKRPKLIDESSTEISDSTKDSNPIGDCEIQQKIADCVTDTRESTESAVKSEQTNGQQDQIEEMEDEMQCSICSEMFVKATTLNCSHTFCKYCIETWNKSRNICPICRTRITSLNATLVLDNVIEKVIKNGSNELKERRQALLEERKKIAESKVPTTNQNNFNRGRGGNRARGRGRENNNSRRGRNYNIPNPMPPAPVIELESSDSDSSTSTTEFDSEDGWSEDYDDDQWYSFLFSAIT